MASSSSVSVENESIAASPPGAALAWLAAALLSATLVAVGDVLLAVQGSAVATPPAALWQALLAAVGLYIAPALLLGSAQALVSDSLRAVFGAGYLRRARGALADASVDARWAGAVLTALGVLALEMAVLYLYVRGVAF